MIKQDWLDDLKNVESVNEKELEKKQSLILELERCHFKAKFERQCFTFFSGNYLKKRTRSLQWK